MNNPQSFKEFPIHEKEGFTIEVDAFADAKPDTIFAELINPESLGDILSCTVEGTIEPGSPIRFVWPEEQDPDCDCNICGGTVVAVEPPHRFAFTWGHEGSAARVPWGESLVEFVIAAESHGARITIRHSKLPSEYEAEQHYGGWSEFADVMAARWAA